MEVDAAIFDVVRRTIDKMYAAQEIRVVDDSEFVPLMGCLVDAVAEHAEVAGRPPKEVARVRGAVMQYATDIYVRLCQEHDPENADEEDDAKIFAYLMKHGCWPK